MCAFEVRTMRQDDRSEVAELIHISINHWYQLHGCPPIFEGGPEVTEVFFDVYESLDPGCGIVAQNTRSGRLMGSCFFHPRAQHVSLGIMNVHPSHFGAGAGRALLQFVIDVALQEKKPLRLTQSALNLDSFSLYNKAGFVPRYSYQDMFVQVPESGMPKTVAGLDRVRDATLADVPAMMELERHVSGITREQDYRYCIENRVGFWHVSIYEGDARDVNGFMISCGHSAMNMIGPGVARTQDQAAALILRELNVHAGRAPVVLVPMLCESLVRQMYSWGARNCEMHFCQVLGEYQPFNGVNVPSFLPETG